MSWQFFLSIYVLRLGTPSQTGKSTDGEILMQCTNLKFGYVRFQKLQNRFRDLNHFHCPFELSCCSGSCLGEGLLTLEFL